MIGSYSCDSMALLLGLAATALAADWLAHRRNRAVSVADAALWSAFWLLLTLAFAWYVGASRRWADASLFLAGYLLETSLSLDNLFVITAIFTSFGIPDSLQRRALYASAPGALIFRILLVAICSALLAFFGTWTLLAFGLLVLRTAWKRGQAIARGPRAIRDDTARRSVLAARKLTPPRFRSDDRPADAPLIPCLIAIGLADALFAFGSVPALFALTREPFLVCASGIFALLGLRSLYFLFTITRERLVYLDKAAVAVLTCIGIKMLIDEAGLFRVPELVNLLVVLGLLICGAAASLLLPAGRD